MVQRHHTLRGFSLLGTVIAFALMAVLVVVAAGATWKLTGTSLEGISDVTDVDGLSTDPVGAAGAPGRIVAAARGVVLMSHAHALASELSAASMSGELTASDVDAALSRFPVTADGTTITASTATFAADRTVRLSDGSATVCVGVPLDARAQVSDC